MIDRFGKEIKKSCILSDTKGKLWLTEKINTYTVEIRDNENCNLLLNEESCLGYWVVDYNIDDF